MPSTWHHVPAGHLFGAKPKSERTPSMSTNSRGLSCNFGNSEEYLRLGRVGSPISLACSVSGSLKGFRGMTDGRGTSRLRQFPPSATFSLFT